MKKKVIWIVVAVVVIAACFLLFRGGSKKSTLSFSTARVERTDIQNAITATGTVEPVTSVTVGTQVSGIVSKLYVDYNSEVKKGQVIAELDKTNLTSELKTARANLTSAQSSLDYEQTNHNRYKTLYEKGLVSADEYESVRLSYIKAREQVTTARENVQKAQTNLGYATITSPIDGVVLSKAVEEGQTVASSFSTPELFIIAQDLTDMRVIADIDEADIGGVKEGQRVVFTVDAFPDEQFEGKVTQVRQQPTTTSNVVTYEVVISAPNDDLKLKPGLTANVTIYTMEKNGVLAVPLKALRFRPNEAILTGYRIEDCDAPTKLWTCEGQTLKAHAVEVGTSNSVLTEIVSGVAEGTTIVTDYTVETSAPADTNSGNNNPFLPGPRNNTNNKSNAAKGNAKS